MDNLFIVMPAYNEAENIRSVVREWYPVLELAGDNSRLVVADSGSTDETDKVLEEMCNEYPKLLILKDTLKQHGPKLIALYKYAITNGADYIFQTDSDGQTLPSEFTQMWNKRNKRDALIGHRIKRGDGASRAFVEKVVCFLLRLYYGVRVPDANAPFRLMRAELVSKYIDRFDEDYNLPNIMLTTFFAYYKENIEFCPITFQNRQGGVNSINIAKIIKIGWRALSDFREFKRGM